MHGILVRASSLALLASSFGCSSFGCSAEPPPSDGGALDASADGATPSPTCDVDRACPEAAPVWSGPCEGTLRCAFDSACGPSSPDVYECVSGQWSLTMPAPCAGGSPPLSESCRDPFTGTIAGARVWLSADAAGAPELHDGDVADVVLGGQGLAMVAYRLHVDGTDVPACVEVTTTLTLDAATGSSSTHRARLRCGSSLRIQDILPELPCDEAHDYAIEIDVAVAGAGALHLALHAMGIACPG